MGCTKCHDYFQPIGVLYISIAWLHYYTICLYDMYLLLYVGFIPSFTESTLTECQDPIVLTSTVNGYCLVDEHCRNLEGTSCTAIDDQVPT